MLPAWWLKFNRGIEHRDALERFIAETFSNEANLPLLGIRFERETLEHVLYVSRTPDHSDFCSRVGLIFGDCVNNLRNSLDYVVYEMGMRSVGSRGLVSPQRIKFPIVSKKENWKAAEGNELRELSPEQRRTIETLQPYHQLDMEENPPKDMDPYHPLEMLRELTDCDKHRLITPIVVPHGNALAVSPIGFAMMASGQCRVMHADSEGLPIQNGSEVWRAKLPEEASRDASERVGLIQSLAVLIHPQRRPIIHLIDKLAATVKNILRVLEAKI